MKARLLSVGKPGDRECVSLHDRYAGRVSKLGLDYASSWVKETRLDGAYSTEHVCQRDTQALLAKADSRGCWIAVDRRGKSLSSEQLADRLPRWATPCAWLFIGGPAGHAAELLDRAQEVWSLSSLTLPHELARVLVAEQLYRALAIRRGIPYHR